jgi:hypothetical protein
MDQTTDHPIVPLVGTEQVVIKKASGKSEPFNPEKLRNSLLRSGATDEAVLSVMAHIEPELYDGISTDDIYRHAFAILHHQSRPAARKYSLRRAIMDLGPSGFPFESFVAEILNAKGFQTLTRQTVLGVCVPHEMDVVAWNDKKLVMVEAKFHNGLGAKSDLKVALYIKARFDDLSGNVFNYGGKDRHVTDSWLVTNTKFSSTAIHYGICNNLTMIGWNYPEKGNLQEMIEEEGLHPITCLASLSDQNKKTLIASDVVLCSVIKDNPEVLNKYLGADFNSSLVIDEINEL